MTSPLRLVLRDRLTVAMRARDRPTMTTLRNVLAALENAEAVPASSPPAEGGSEHVAGGAVGVGAGEAARRHLSAEDERHLVQREVDELRSSAAVLAAAGQHERSGDLLRSAETVEQVLAR